MEDLDKLQDLLGYKFNNIEFLKTSLTHPSYKNENPDCVEDNQRMEFLGDSAIGFAISLILFESCPSFNEGRLTKLKAEIVREESLAENARKIELGKFILIGKGESLTGGLNRDSILSDAFESLMGSIFLDGGFDRFIIILRDIMNETIEETIAKNTDRDYKTRFQEICQRELNTVPRYLLIEENGPDHDKTFTVTLKIKRSLISAGTGRSKKEAEQDAAKKAILLFKDGKLRK